MAIFKVRLVLHFFARVNNLHQFYLNISNKICKILNYVINKKFPLKRIMNIHMFCSLFRVVSLLIAQSDTESLHFIEHLFSNQYSSLGNSHSIAFRGIYFPPAFVQFCQRAELQVVKGKGNIIRRAVLVWMLVVKVITHSILCAFIHHTANKVIIVMVMFARFVEKRNKPICCELRDNLLHLLNLKRKFSSLISAQILFCCSI